MYKLIVYGKASTQKILEIEIGKAELNCNLLEFLRKAKIPIASSCNGEGICRKCVVNNQVLSCQIKLIELFDKNSQSIIEIAYL